jgi:hypothetical protein
VPILLQKSAGSVGPTFSGPSKRPSKKHVGSTQATAHATRGFPSRATMLLNSAFSLRRLLRRFSTPPNFRILQQTRP